jgi:hypothetical protein
VVIQLRNLGHPARILTRHRKGQVDADLATGARLLKAVSGMDAIIHAT